MKAVILNYTGGRANWGSQATSTMLAEFLADALRGHDISQIDTVPLPPPYLTDALRRNSQGKTLTKLFASKNLSTTELEYLSHQTQQRFGDLFARMAQADLVFFQGEGTISDSEFFSDLRLFALPLLATRWFGKPLVTLNQTISVGYPGAEDIISAVMETAKLNVFRETESVRLAKRLNLPSIAFCPDAAFLIGKNAKPRDPQAHRSHFCVTGSAILDDVYVADFNATLMRIVQKTGLQPVFLAATGRDAKLHKAYTVTSGRDARLITQTDARSYTDLLPVVSASAFTIGGRYHTSIKSAAIGTPVILLESNSQKSAGLSHMLFGSNRVRKAADQVAIMADVQRILSNPAIEQHTLEQVIASFDDHFSALRSQIREIATPVADALSHPQRSRTATTLFNGRQKKILGLSKPFLNLKANLNCYDCAWRDC